jgi:hypothetical protein
MYLRPRPRRFEVCSEYIEEARLGAVATFVAGSVRACAAQLAGSELEALPPVIETTLLPSDSRYGLYLSRRAFGGDLYQAGRESLLNRRHGGTITAQEQLEEAWQSARAALLTSVEPDELRAVDRLVRAKTRLPVEASAETFSSYIDASEVSIFGAVTLPRHRGDLTIAATLATWDFTVFEASSGERRVYACIPREYLHSFLQALDGGRLDGLLIASLQRPGGNRVLKNQAQTAQPGLWDRVGEPRDLLAPERTPTGAIVLRPADTNGRSGKVASVVATASRRPFNALFALLLVVLAAASVAMGYMLTRDDSEPSIAAVIEPSPTATATATASPSPTATVAALATLAPVATAVPPTPTVAVVTPTVAPTPTPIPPTATPVPPNLVASVGPVAAIFNQPAQATTYTVQNSGPGLTFAWTVSEPCGSLVGADTNGFTWSHPHPPCDATNHAGTLVQVIVTDPANNRVRCNYQGAISGAGPPCEPF